MLTFRWEIEHPPAYSELRIRESIREFVKVFEKIREIIWEIKTLQNEDFKVKIKNVPQKL